MTILLNSRELKEFEAVYQGLRNHPAWTMENIFHQKTFERSEFEKCSNLFYSRIKQNRLMLAAHEAAHVLVLMGTHQRVNSAEIDIENGSDLLGLVRTGGECKNASNSRLIEQDSKIPCRPLIAMDILVQSAGFLGESLARRKTGSYHEKFLVYCQSRFLDDMDGLQPLTNWSNYVTWGKRIILNNEHLFWRIANELLKNSKLSSKFTNLLHNQIVKEPAHKFFN